MAAQKYEELRAVGVSTCTFDIEPAGYAVKLTVTHEVPESGEAFIGAVSNGWPQILSSMKTLLETGEPLGSNRPAAA